MERKEIDKTRPVTYYLSLTDEQLNFLSSNEEASTEYNVSADCFTTRQLPIPHIPSVAYQTTNARTNLCICP